MEEEEGEILPTLTQKIKRPTRTNARESKEVNSKIFELVVNQMNLEKIKESKENIRRTRSLRERLRKKKEEDKKKLAEKKEREMKKKRRRNK